MKISFQYLKIPYGENILTLLGSECIKAYEVTKSEKNEYKGHFHNLMEIAVCRSGSGEVIIDEKRYTYKKDDMIVIPRNFPHLIAADPEEKSFWEYIYVKPNTLVENIYQADKRKKDWFMENVEPRAFLKSKEDEPELFAEINLIMDQCRRRGYQFRKSVNGLLFVLFIEIIRINQKECEKPEYSKELNAQKVEILGAALEYIEVNFAKDLRTGDIARSLYVSETCLRRLFAEICGVSPMQYAKIIRIEKACELLENNKININQIAYKVGYTNISTFIKNFKEVTGKTPKDWRQNIRQKVQ